MYAAVWLHLSCRTRTSSAAIRRVLSKRLAKTFLNSNKVIGFGAPIKDCSVDKVPSRKKSPSTLSGVFRCRIRCPLKTRRPAALVGVTAHLGLFREATLAVGRNDPGHWWNGRRRFDGGADGQSRGRTRDRHRRNGRKMPTCFAAGGRHRRSTTHSSRSSSPLRMPLAMAWTFFGRLVANPILTRRLNCWPNEAGWY